MVQLTDFTGTWRAEHGAPFSSHKFTWALRDGHLVGRWILAVPNVAAATVAGRPTWAEMQIGEPWLEDGVLFFYVNGGPFMSEFRLLGQAEAVVGVALHKLARRPRGRGGCRGLCTPRPCRQPRGRRRSHTDQTERRGRSWANPSLDKASLRVALSDLGTK